MFFVCITNSQLDCVRLEKKIKKLKKKHTKKINKKSVFENNDQGIKDFIPIEVDKNSYECGTRACFAGYLPYVTGIKKSKNMLWSEYIEKVTGINGDNFDYDFLFNGGHDNCLEQAKKRLRKFINNGYKVTRSDIIKIKAIK